MITFWDNHQRLEKKKKLHKIDDDREPRSLHILLLDTSPYFVSPQMKTLFVVSVKQKNCVKSSGERKKKQLHAFHHHL